MPKSFDAIGCSLAESAVKKLIGTLLMGPFRMNLAALGFGVGCISTTSNDIEYFSNLRTKV
jgi:hypothetical protein